MSVYVTLSKIGLSFISWSITYNCSFFIPYQRYFHLTKPSKKNEFHCRFVTFLHAVAVVLTSGWSVFVHRTWPYSDPAGSNTGLQDWICTFSLGYFLFDFSWCLYHKTEGLVMLAHHCLTILGLWVTLYRGVHGSELIGTLFVTEITNPLLQIRWFILNLDINHITKSSKLDNDSEKKSCNHDYNNNGELYIEGNEQCGSDHIMNKKSEVKQLKNEKTQTKNIAFVDFLFFALFTFMRLILGSVFLISYLSFDKPDLLARFGCLSIYTISWLFWFEMVKYLKKSYFEKKKIC